MPPRRTRGSSGGAHGPEGGGSIELASAYVSIMPETSKVAPGVRKAAQEAGRELDQNISNAMRTAFQRSETYATGFANHVASANVGVMRSMNQVIDSTNRLGSAHRDLNRVMNDKKATLSDVTARQSAYDKALRDHSANVEQLGVRLANFNQQQQRFSELGARRVEQEARRDQQTFNRNMSAAMSYSRAQQNFMRTTGNRFNDFYDKQAYAQNKLMDQQTKQFETNMERQARIQNKAFDQQQYRQSLAGQAEMFKRGQSAMRDELAYTAQFGTSSWQRMNARMALEGAGTARSFRSSMTGALDDISTHAEHVGRGIRTGLLSSFGAPMAIAGAGGLGLLGGAAAAGGIDRVLSGGLRRIETIQNAQVSMSQVIPDQKQASSIVNQAVDLSQGTPYGADAFLNMARNMATMGVRPDQIVPAIRAMGDSGAVMGRPASSLDQLSREFGKIKAEGRIMGRDVVELQRVGGINARDIIANHMGWTGEQLTAAMGKKGGLQVDPDTIIQWLTEGIEQGSTGKAGSTPAYAGGMQKMRGTLTGATEVLKSQIDRIGAAFLGGADINHPTGVMAALPGIINKLTGTDVSGKHDPNGLAALADAGGAIDRFQQKISQSGVAAGFVSEFEKLPGLFGKALDGAGALMDAFRKPATQNFIHMVENDVSELRKDIQKVAPGVEGVAKSLATGFGGTALTGLNMFTHAMSDLVPLLNAVTGFLNQNKTAVELLVGVYAALALKNKAVEMSMGPLSAVMGAFNKTVMDSATGAVRNESMWSRMGSTYQRVSNQSQSLGGIMKGSLASGMSAVRDVGGGLMAMLGGPLGIAIEGTTVLLGYLADKHAQAAASAQAQTQAEKELQGQLEEGTGAMTDAARTTITHRMEDQGLNDKSKALGLDPHAAVIAATSDNDQVVDDYIATVNKAIAQNPSLRAEGEALIQMVKDQTVAYYGASKAQQAHNEAMYGSFAATQKATEYFKNLGAEIMAVPKQDEIVVQVNDQQGIDNIMALKAKGVDVQQDLNNPNKFIIHVNTDQAKSEFDGFVNHVDNTPLKPQIQLDPNSAQQMWQQIADMAAGHPINIPWSLAPGQNPWTLPGGPSLGNAPAVGGAAPQPLSPPSGTPPSTVVPPLGLPPAPPPAPGHAFGGRFATGGRFKQSMGGPGGHHTVIEDPDGTGLWVVHHDNEGNEHNTFIPTHRHGGRVGKYAGGGVPGGDVTSDTGQTLNHGASWWSAIKKTFDPDPRDWFKDGPDPSDYYDPNDPDALSNGGTSLAPGMRGPFADHPTYNKPQQFAGGGRFKQSMGGPGGHHTVIEDPDGTGIWVVHHDNEGNEHNTFIPTHKKGGMTLASGNDIGHQLFSGPKSKFARGGLPGANVAPDPNLTIPPSNDPNFNKMRVPGWWDDALRGGSGHARWWQAPYNQEPLPAPGDQSPYHPPTGDDPYFPFSSKRFGAGGILGLGVLGFNHGGEPTAGGNWHDEGKDEKGHQVYGTPQDSTNYLPGVESGIAQGLPPRTTFGGIWNLQDHYDAGMNRPHTGNDPHINDWWKGPTGTLTLMPKHDGFPAYPSKDFQLPGVILGARHGKRFGGGGVLGLGVLGFHHGGKCGCADCKGARRAAGGARMIQGPGTGTSDSIPGLVGGQDPILVSNGESINTAMSTNRNWPVIEAMNRGLTLTPSMMRRWGVRGFKTGGQPDGGADGGDDGGSDPNFGADNPSSAAPGPGVPSSWPGQVNDHMSVLERELHNQQEALIRADHDIEIANQHLEELKTRKKPPEPSEQARADETLRRAEQRHDDAQRRIEELEGKIANPEPTRSRGGGGGSGHGGGGESEFTGASLGKTFIDGIMQTFGFDGSVFGDPRQFAGVKSIMAALSAAVRPLQLFGMESKILAGGGLGGSMLGGKSLIPGGSDVDVAQHFLGTKYSQQLRDDCSGMVGRVVLGALGMPGDGPLPTTQTMGPWLAKHGFEPGMGAPGEMSVGWYNGGPGGGHAAMTLSNGMPAEQGGSNPAFTMGGGAAGADNPEFKYHAHLPAGGGYGAPSAYGAPSPYGAPGSYGAPPAEGAGYGTPSGYGPETPGTPSSIPGSGGGGNSPYLSNGVPAGTGASLFGAGGDSGGAPGGPGGGLAAMMGGGGNGSGMGGLLGKIPGIKDLEDAGILKPGFTHPGQPGLMDPGGALYPGTLFPGLGKTPMGGPPSLKSLTDLPPPPPASGAHHVEEAMNAPHSNLNLGPGQSTGHTVGNVTFNLDKGATLGWDPKTVFSESAKQSSMAVNAYQNRSVTL